MSLPEIIPSNLPQFVQNKNRSAFENSVIPSGSVLLFAESDGNGGSKLIAKNPDGSFTEVGGGGGGGGGSMNFYKCSAVDTVNEEWSGNLASVDPVTGVWSFASTATTGLEYDRITPVVGHVYDESCTFEVKSYKTGIPTDGLIFYLPLDEYPGDTDPVGGHQLHYGSTSNISYGQTLNGVIGTTLGSYAAITGPDFSSILANTADTAFTISCWFAHLNYDAKIGGFGFGNKVADSGFPDIHTGGLGDTNSDNGNTRYGALAGGVRDVRCYSQEMTGLHHVLVTCHNNIVLLYVDGAYESQGSYHSTDHPFDGYASWAPGVIGYGYVSSPPTLFYSAFRIYNRVLDSTEISALASEFSPTPAS